MLTPTTKHRLVYGSVNYFERKRLQFNFAEEEDGLHSLHVESKNQVLLVNLLTSKLEFSSIVQTHQ